MSPIFYFFYTQMPSYKQLQYTKIVMACTPPSFKCPFYICSKNFYKGGKDYFLNLNKRAQYLGGAVPPPYRLSSLINKYSFTAQGGSTQMRQKGKEHHSIIHKMMFPIKDIDCVVPAGTYLHFPLDIFHNEGAAFSPAPVLVHPWLAYPH